MTFCSETGSVSANRPVHRMLSADAFEVVGVCQV